MTDYSREIERIGRAQSIEDIRNIVREFSAAGNGRGGILYSGWVGDIRSETIALEIAERTGQPIINNTPRGQFLANERVEQAIKDAARRVFVDEGMPADMARQAAGNFLYGDGRAPANSPTSLSRSLWGEASRDFAGSLRGDITVVASQANPERVFGQVEIPAALRNPNITSLGGQSMDALRATQQQGGAVAVLQEVQRPFIDASRQGIFIADTGSDGRPSRVSVSREVASALDLDARRFPPAAELEAAGLRRAALTPVTAAPTVPGRTPAAAADALDVDAPRGGMRSAAVRGAGIAGLALSIYDGADTARNVRGHYAQGNRTAAESAMVHFGARSLGGWGGALLGMGVGAAAGVETGPGMLATGAIGGVVGVFAGDRLAAWSDNRRIYNQTDPQGNTWTFNPDQPSQGWQRRARIDGVDDGIDNPTRGDMRAAPDLANRLSYQSTTTSAELILGSPPVPRNPFEQNGWTRNPDSGDWQRVVVGPFVERGMAPRRTETADPQLAAQLDRAAAQTLLQNAANSPAAIAARFEESYARNGWAAYGPVPAAVSNARTNTDALMASDGNFYQRGADGQWISEGTIYNSTARGAVRAELDATREVLQGVLPPRVDLRPPPPLTADEQLRGVISGLYADVGVTLSTERLQASVAAVKRTHDAHGLVLGQTALQLQPDASGRYGADSPIASLRRGDDGAYRIEAVTSAEDIRRVQSGASTIPLTVPSSPPAAESRRDGASLEIERLSPRDRDVFEQTLRLAQQQGLPQGAAQNAALAMTASVREDPQMQRVDRMMVVNDRVFAAYLPHGDREPIFHTQLDLRQAAAVPLEDSLRRIEQAQQQQVAQQQAQGFDDPNRDANRAPRMV